MNVHLNPDQFLVELQNYIETEFGKKPDSKWTVLSSDEIKIYFFPGTDPIRTMYYFLEGRFGLWFIIFEQVLNLDMGEILKDRPSGKSESHFFELWFTTDQPEYAADAICQDGSGRLYYGQKIANFKFRKINLDKPFEVSDLSLHPEGSRSQLPIETSLFAVHVFARIYKKLQI